MDEVVLCTKDRVGLDNFIDSGHTFLSLCFIMSKNELFSVCMIGFEILYSN